MTKRKVSSSYSFVLNDKSQFVDIAFHSVTFGRRFFHALLM